MSLGFRNSCFFANFVKDRPSSLMMAQHPRRSLSWFSKCFTYSKREHAIAGHEAGFPERLRSPGIAMSISSSANGLVFQSSPNSTGTWKSYCSRGTEHFRATAKRLEQRKGDDEGNPMVRDSLKRWTYPLTLFHLVHAQYHIGGDSRGGGQ